MKSVCGAIFATTVLIPAVAAFTFTSAGPGINVSVDAETGAYHVAARGGATFGGLDYRLATNGTLLSVANGTLLMQPGGAVASNGTDSLGAFERISLSWEAASAPGACIWVTSFQVYPAQGAVLFRQQFPAGLRNTAAAAGRGGVDAGGLIATFPALRWQAPATTHLGAAPGATPSPVEAGAGFGFVTWNGLMAGDSIKTGSWPTAQGETFGAADGGPLLLFSDGGGNRPPPAGGHASAKIGLLGCSSSPQVGAGTPAAASARSLAQGTAAAAWRGMLATR